MKVAIDLCGSTIAEAEAAYAIVRERPWLADRFPLGPREFLAAAASFDAPPHRRRASGDPSRVASAAGPLELELDPRLAGRRRPSTTTTV